ncbi:MAG TPA: DMT family transporter [Pseudolabrys sp.]|jgi:drug/metabolite transporter (DMT)-like permease|nr:DMT family transporter [Pseudolabrys sp.]
MAEPPQTIDARTAQLLLFLSIIWGGSFFFTGAAIRELPPLTVALARVTLGALFLLPFFRMLGGTWPRTFADWMPFLGMGILNNVIPFSLQAAAQLYVSSGVTSVLNATTPVFGVIVLAAFGDEKLIARRAIGVAVGLIGVVVLRGVTVEPGQTLGILLGLGGALSYGFAGLWGRRMLAHVPSINSATCQLICSTAIMLVLASAIERPWQLPMPSTTAMLALVGLAAISTSLAYIVFFTILRRSGATNTLLVTLLIPVTAILLGHFVLGEPLHTREIAGAIIIGSALLVIDGRVFGLLYRRT